MPNKLKHRSVMRYLKIEVRKKIAALNLNKLGTFNHFVVQSGMLETVKVL